MRTLEDHKVNPANDRLTIKAADAPGAGGAHHRYEVTGLDLGTNPVAEPPEGNYDKAVILFQNGPIPEAGVNGLTHQVLLTIIADRLRCFQAGPYACAENFDALQCVESALFHLKSRTLKRMNRGVEGTHTV